MFNESTQLENRIMHRKVFGSEKKSSREEDRLKPLYDAIVAGKLEPAVEVTKDAIAAGVLPQEIINGYMITAMGEVGQRFQDGSLCLSALMAGRAMKGALEL